MTQLRIERHGMFDYRWSINGIGGYCSTRYGAIYAAKRYLRSRRNYLFAKETAEIIELDG